MRCDIRECNENLDLMKTCNPKHDILLGFCLRSQLIVLMKIKTQTIKKKNRTYAKYSAN